MKDPRSSLTLKAREQNTNIFDIPLIITQIVETERISIELSTKVNKNFKKLTTNLLYQKALCKANIPLCI
jgi:hypothetical protein